MAELVDALASGASARKGVEVQVLSCVPRYFTLIFAIQESNYELMSILPKTNEKLFSWIKKREPSSLLFLPYIIAFMAFTEFALGLKDRDNYIIGLGITSYFALLLIVGLVKMTMLYSKGQSVHMSWSLRIVLAINTVINVLSIGIISPWKHFIASKVLESLEENEDETKSELSNKASYILSFLLYITTTAATLCIGIVPMQNYDAFNLVLTIFIFLYGVLFIIYTIATGVSSARAEARDEIIDKLPQQKEKHLRTKSEKIGLALGIAIGITALLLFIVAPIALLIISELGII